MKKILTAVLLFAVFLSIGIAEAVPTKLIVRAKSKDAKFVGTSMGGALIVVKDSETGKVLAEGLTAGATGNTQKIMIKPHFRFGSIVDSSTAKFETVIDINEPRLITIYVEAPYGFKPDTIKVSTQVWLLPGKDLAGDGVIVEVPGFSIVAQTQKEVKLAGNRAVIPIQARVAMIWGCKLTPGGLWDSSKYEIKALVKHKGKITDTVNMGFTGPSTFKGEASVSEKGTYEIIVYAYDPQTGNTGVNKVVVKVN